MWQNRVANKATAEFTQVKMCSSHRRQAISFGSLSYTNRTKERNPFIDFSTLVGWAMVQTDKQTEQAYNSAGFQEVVKEGREWWV